ncbi:MULTISPECIES: hypothetical protein [unclassified Sphingomonas]|uniref:hypothetical protein n=1 Tax=unclassified Sphingomonas TaxID=196159 RepID=UPI0006FDF44E|nr:MULTISPECIES: hypothetical protein [unclassified Sphingomonas]KQM66673.1 hypothetical protein ASE65_00835 [Sphingomonas sp. Leaf16]KQN17622.1 hypothetical protein ASE81_00215 [Sphingomonas sp. Leaf29]KQN23486.1 hypothetical protein ASE83_03095 [Sphingomonas sp. Leaf32]
MPPRASRYGAARIALTVQTLGFSAGAFNHGLDFLRFGWRPYRWAPLPAFELYWSALLFLDLAVVVLLASGRIRPGLLLGVAIMVSDVAINILATRLAGFSDFGVALLWQSAFLGFVLGSIGFLWSATKRPAAAD